jgi:hypothetical protein
LGNSRTGLEIGIAYKTPDQPGKTEISGIFYTILFLMAAPPFTAETAVQKVKKAQDLWNTRYANPENLTKTRPTFVI